MRKAISSRTTWPAASGSAAFLKWMEVVMTYDLRRLAGILLIVLPTVMFGGASILSLLIGDPNYMKNPLRQDLWRAGHAHAGVWLVLALVALRYVDEASLSNSMKWLVRGSIPIAAILVPAWTIPLGSVTSTCRRLKEFVTLSPRDPVFR
jgi:hypothetical protein